MRPARTTAPLLCNNLNWRSVWVSIPSARLERPMTSPEVQRNRSLVPQATYRTRDLSLTRRLLFHLSYRGKIHFGCTFARVAGMKPHQVLSLRRRWYCNHPLAHPTHRSRDCATWCCKGTPEMERTVGLEPTTLSLENSRSAN